MERNVAAAPEWASVACSRTVTGVATQLLSDSMVVTGGSASTLTLTLLVASTLPTASVERYSSVLTPEFETLTGAE